MPKITYVSAAQAVQTIDVPVGTSVMRGAVSNDIDGIVARCGGNAQCATCHVFVDPTNVDQLEPIRPNEEEMLEFTACTREEHSRLSCQLEVTEALDGLTVHLPDRQI
ncbi:2Fe-2S iron-sulfur cluster-binding protein [Streptomyces sp. H27-D2]|uniref:2Fe-2S iron-sulfur cluster-binding protein n=1 Tax=Streptomyces sp. H27-D2 TaxID=3046304 RepID=UPI002DB8A24A|nr:2Fe-2S iron-sulfur cluster-binding protein [Streptomyces sp. H27-D2]MEC4017547.1 2Fe-2S iron-sulfur cluster-binding protein [Streptomyces sp. H27-D2]